MLIALAVPLGVYQPDAFTDSVVPAALSSFHYSSSFGASPAKGISASQARGQGEECRVSCLSWQLWYCRLDCELREQKVSELDKLNVGKLQTEAPRAGMTRQRVSRRVVVVETCNLGSKTDEFQGCFAVYFEYRDASIFVLRRMIVISCDLCGNGTKTNVNGTRRYRIILPTSLLVLTGVCTIPDVVS